MAVQPAHVTMFPATAASTVANLLNTFALTEQYRLAGKTDKATKAMVPTLKKKPAGAETETPANTEYRPTFMQVWNCVKDKHTHWEARGSGQRYQRPDIPEKVAQLPLEERLNIFKLGMPNAFPANDMAKMLINICSHDEMAQLYGRFSTARRSARAEVQRQWDAISSMQWRSGMQEKKAKVLAMQVAKPHQWEDFVLQETHELRKEEIDQVTRKRFYYGELEKKHGNDEVDWMIRARKLEEIEDSDGDVCYAKKQHTEISTDTHSETASFQKKWRMLRGHGRRIGGVL